MTPIRSVRTTKDDKISVLMADQPQHWDSTAQLLQAELLHASSSVRSSKCLFKLLFSKIKPAISVGKYLLQPSVFLTENGKKGLFNCCKRSTEKSLIILQGLLMLKDSPLGN